MRLTVVRLQFESGLKIRRRRLGLAKVVLHISAVDIGSHCVGFPMNGFSKVGNRLLVEPPVFMNVAGKQRNIGLFRQNVPVFRCKGKKIVVLSEKEQIVPQIDNYFAIVGQRLDSFLELLLPIPGTCLRGEDISRSRARL